MDEKYKREKQLERATNRPSNAAEGALQGLKGFGMGFVKGVTGIVEKPIEGAKEEGGLGFIKGVGKGVFGVVAKPIAGTAELISRTTEGVKNTSCVLCDLAVVAVCLVSVCVCVCVATQFVCCWTQFAT